MKTKSIIIIIVVIAVVGIGLWAGLGRKKGAEEVTPGEEGAGEGVGETAESLSEILGKVKDVGSLKYDMVVAYPDHPTATSSVWLKGKKMRMETTVEGQKTVYLMDMNEQLAYLYIPAQNMAMEMNFGEAEESIGESPTEQSGTLMDYSPAIVGSEILNGKSCLVVEYSTEAGKTKMWIWKDYGFPIKTESTTAQGTYTSEVKNIEFGDIPDSTFELPAGVQMMEIPSF
jgi:outer membrane lipoprotein-sorting protein